MIEKIVLDFLNNKKIKAFMEKPSNLKEYVIIEKTGGKKSNHLCNSTIAIQSISTTLLKASKLNEKIKELMNDLTLYDNVIKIELNADYNFTDVDTKTYRYQAVFNITYY